MSGHNGSLGSSFFDTSYSGNGATAAEQALQVVGQQQQQQHDNSSNSGTSAGSASSTLPSQGQTNELGGAADDDDFNKSTFTLRAIVTSKEAGVIIGKQGKNVADMRDETSVKAGVTKPVIGIQERVLTVSGSLEGVVTAYGMAAQTLIDSPPVGNYVHALSPPAPPGIATIRLLVSHQQMGTVIGRQGSKIKAIQEDCKVRMVASKDMLPQSTERVVEIQGTSEAVRAAILEIGKCLVEDWERATGTIPYYPHVRVNSNNNGHHSNSNGSRYASHSRNMSTTHELSPLPPANQNTSGAAQGDEATREISFSSDLVGCIIGRGGTKIQEIRRVSGARISIEKQGDLAGDRKFTINGTTDAIQKALTLLYEQVDNEKARRIEDGANDDNA